MTNGEQYDVTIRSSNCEYKGASVHHALCIVIPYEECITDGKNFESFTSFVNIE